MDTVEIAWTVVAVMGLVSSAVMLWFTNHQRLAMRGIQNGKRRQLRKNIRNEVARGLIHLINILIAIGALLNKQPVQNADGAWILVATSAILMSTTLLDARMALQDWKGGDAARDLEHDRAGE